MRILNKHTEPPLCHYEFCPAIHISPYSVSPNLVCPYLSYLSANYAPICTYPLPYLSIFLSKP